MTQTDTTKWLADLGVKFVDVLIFVKDKEPFYEQHVEDLTTLPDTVRMSLEKHGAKHAVYPWMGRWAVTRPTIVGDVYAPTEPRYYDTKEAAEMVAIHRG